VGRCPTWWPPSRIYRHPLRKFCNSIPCTAPQSLADAHCWSACRAVTLPIYRRTQDLETQSEFCTWQNSVRGQEPPKCIYSIPAQETAKHRVKFGWPPMSDVGAVMTPRRETCWNLVGCPKLTKRSQPLVGWSSPYCEDMWRRYLLFNSFFPIVDTCLSCEDIARQIALWWADIEFLAIFCVLCMHWATSCVDVWKTSNRRRLRIGERKKRKKKEETTAAIYSVRICYAGRP